MLSDAYKYLQTPGSIGVIPTDTLYGVVARAADEAAVKRLYALKKRERKPGTLIAANLEQLTELGLKRRYLKAVEQFWPGPISVIIPVSDPRLKYLHHGQMSLAVRLPSDRELNQLLTKTGPLLTSSANQPGLAPASSIKEAQDYFKIEVDFYIDGGDLSKRQPSTIIRIIDDAIDVVREGAVKIVDGKISP